MLRHKHVESRGIQFVPESNDLMRSYAMLDALGRFYSNESGGHVYGPSILEVGVQKAWEENEFIEQRFHDRGGYMIGQTKNKSKKIICLQDQEHVENQPSPNIYTTYSVMRELHLLMH